jgi:hypothetical protein
MGSSSSKKAGVRGSDSVYVTLIMRLGAGGLAQTVRAAKRLSKRQKAF